MTSLAVISNRPPPTAESRAFAYPTIRCTFFARAINLTISSWALDVNCIYNFEEINRGTINVLDLKDARRRSYNFTKIHIELSRILIKYILLL